MADFNPYDTDEYGYPTTTVQQLRLSRGERLVDEGSELAAARSKPMAPFTDEDIQEMVAKANANADAYLARLEAERAARRARGYRPRDPA